MASRVFLLVYGFLIGSLNFSVCFQGSSNVGDTLPTGQLSNIPWRRAGVKYTNNEAYFDVIEEIDAIIDKSGKRYTKQVMRILILKIEQSIVQ